MRAGRVAAMAAILSCVVLGVATDRLPVGSLNPVSPAKDYWVRLAEDIKISDPSIAKQSELSAGEPFCGDLTCTHPSREARKLVGLVWTHHKIGKGAYLGCAPIFTAINMRAELYLWLKPQKTERHRPLDDRAWRASVVYRDNVDVRPPRLETYDARIKEAPYVALEIHNKEVSPLQISQRTFGYMHTPAHPDTLVYESAELKDRSADQPDRKPLVPPFGRRLAIFAILSGSGLWVSLWGVSNLYDKRHRVATYAIAAGSVAFVAGWLVWFVTAFTWSWGWPV